MADTRANRGVKLWKVPENCMGFASGWCEEPPMLCGGTLGLKEVLELWIGMALRTYGYGRRVS